MKRTKETILKLIAFNFLQAAIVLAGHEAGGGDSYALEFTALGGKVVDYLQVNDSIHLIDLEKIERQVKVCEIVSVENLFLNEKEVDAINHPEENRIEISRTRWKSYGSNLNSKLALVFHEYLSVAGIDDSQYEVSKQYASQLQKLSLLFAKSDHYHSEVKLVEKVIESQCLLKMGECGIGTDPVSKTYSYFFTYILKVNLAYIFSNGSVTKVTSEKQENISGPGGHPSTWPKQQSTSKEACEKVQNRHAGLYPQCIY